MMGQRSNQQKWFWKRIWFLQIYITVLHISITYGAQKNKDVYVAPGGSDNDVYTSFTFLEGDVLQLNIHKKNQTTPNIAESHITDQDTSDTVLWRKTGQTDALHTYQLAGPNGQGIKQNEPFYLKVHGTFAIGGGGGGVGSPANAPQFDASVIDVVITQPTQGENDAYPSQPDYNSTGPLPFTAVVRGASYAGTITWVQTLNYEAGGQQFQAPLQGLNSGNGQTVNRAFQSVGGCLVTWASATVKNIACLSPYTTSYITGCSGGIPDPTITARLRALYNPPRATAGLLTGIAFAESSYAQFANRTKYGITAKWPKESPTTPSGQYIGLMQVPVAMNSAWDWLVNTQLGATTYAEKLALTDSDVAYFCNQHPGLPALTGFQSEKYALGLYAGYLDKYYSPVLIGGTWQWKQTTNQALLNYVALVLNNIK